MVNLNLLRIFNTAAEKTNFSAAAEELLITQPTVSLQIKALETQYGLVLFKRIGKKLELTDSGRLLLKYTKRIFDLATETEELLHDLRRDEEGIIRLRIGKTYGKSFISPILSQFKKKFPKVKIILKEGNSEDSLNCILKHEADFALIGVSIVHPRKALELIRIGNEELFLVVWPSHRLANRKSVSFSELEDEPFVLREKGSMVRELVIAKFEQEKIKPNVAVETENISTLIELIREEEGIGFLPKFIVDQELKIGRLKAISLVEKPHLDGYIVFLKNSYMSQTKKAFIKILAEFISQGLRPNFLDLEKISHYL
jgi:DNA-binding transcriptional LysR family regulator